MDIFAKNCVDNVSSTIVVPLCRGLQRRNHGGGVRACHGRLRNISTEIHLVIQYRRGHWSTNEGLGCGDVCGSTIYSDDAVSWRRSVDQLEGASFFSSWKIGSESRVNCKLVERADG